MEEIIWSLTHRQRDNFGCRHSKYSSSHVILSYDSAYSSLSAPLDKLYIFGRCAWLTGGNMNRLSVRLRMLHSHAETQSMLHC